jgi:hypothetical protein
VHGLAHRLPRGNAYDAHERGRPKELPAMGRGGGQPEELRAMGMDRGRPEELRAMPRDRNRPTELRVMCRSPRNCVRCAGAVVRIWRKFTDKCRGMRMGRAHPKNVFRYVCLN